MKAIKNPKICFFGDRNKLLIYNIDKNSWKLYFIKDSKKDLEFNYYSAAVSLPNGDCILTGGGDS